MANARTAKPGRLAVSMENLDLLMISGLALVGIVFGGAGPHSPVATMIVQLMAIPILLRNLPWITISAPARAARIPLLLAGVTVLLVTLQLVPLPPAIWMALPGRTLFVETVDVIGLPQAWRPLSLDPENTRRELLSLLPPLAMFLGTLRLDEERRVLVVRTILGGALLSIVVGIAQITMAPPSLFDFFAVTPSGVPVGFFANRNHQASFLAACVALTPILIFPNNRSLGRDTSRFNLILFFVFPIAAVATASRMGTLMMVLALLLAMANLMVSQPSLKKNRTVLIAAGVLLVTLSLIAFFSISAVTGRLASAAEDARLTFWPEVIWALKQYFPIGSGFGTFDLVFRSAEPLALVSPKFVNHAHNDYLELVLEGGLAAAAAILAFLIWFGTASLRAWRPTGRPSWDDSRRRFAMPASSTILIMLAHSIVDYPLRTDTLALIFAFSCALLIPNRHDVYRQRDQD